MTPVPLVAKLVAALAEAGVSYCHWKSNVFLDQAERGETDLDLLVDIRNVPAFEAVLDSCGFARAERPHVEDPPGVAHYFGYDSAAGRFVHVHAHDQLIVGHDRSKNFRLPIEAPFLASVQSRNGLPIPSPEFEYVVLVIRFVLKYALWDEVLWSAMRGKKAGPTPSEVRELEALSALVQPDRVTAIVGEHVPSIGVALFRRSERLFENSSVRTRLDVGRRVRRAMADNARKTAAVDTGIRIWRRLALTIRRRLGKAGRFQLSNGGALIAVLGGDGAGKSTALAELDRWLSRDFSVDTVHLGRPPWSWTTYTVRAALKAAQVVGLNGEQKRLVWYACKVRDRYRAYRKAQRASERGTIVLADRFPHPALVTTDLPQIAKDTGDLSSRSHRWLASLEDRYDKKLGLPDLTFVLLVEPAEAARRKDDEPYDYVLRRSTEIWEMDWTRHDVHVIDAALSPQAVATAMKSMIWDALS